MSTSEKAPAIGIQACREEDRAMLTTDAGQELVRAAMSAVSSEQAPAGEVPIKTWQHRTHLRPSGTLSKVGLINVIAAMTAEITELRAALSTPPAVPPQVKETPIPLHKPAGELREVPRGMWKMAVERSQVTIFFESDDAAHEWFDAVSLLSAAPAAPQGEQP